VAPEAPSVPTASATVGNVPWGHHGSACAPTEDSATYGRHGGVSDALSVPCGQKDVRRLLAPERGFQKVVIDESARLTDDRP
jgi:hypothetical protein